MDAVEFLKERARMCDTHKKHCRGCPASVLSTCSHPKEEVEAKQLVAVVEKWSKENPVVTNGKKILELIAGEASQWESGGTSNGMVQIRVSKKWWDAEYKGEQ